jgi:hypothetical protein
VCLYSKVKESELRRFSYSESRELSKDPVLIGVCSIFGSRSPVVVLRSDVFSLIRSLGLK